MAKPEHLVILGAAGQMTAVVARLVCAADPALRVTLADRNADGLAALSERIGGDRAATVTLDLFDDAALRRLIEGASFVIHGAGPFHRTAATVMRACITAGASYMDIDDDVESTLDAIDLDAAARLAGVTLYVGHGASPGFSNLLALDALRRLDEPDVVEVAWCAGDSGGSAIGRAVAEHTLHIGAGSYTGWRDGRRSRRESFATSTVFPLADPLGETRLYECAHPEPVMLGFSQPRLRDVVCWGGLHPPPLSGALRGLAVAVRDGRLELDEACAFLQSSPREPEPREPGRAGATAEAGRRASRAARFALGGMLGQVVRRESSLRALWGALRSRRTPRSTQPSASGLGARARGRHAGRPAEVIVRARLGVPEEGAGGASSMADITGACEAAFFALARAGGAAPGVAFPEMWAEPAAFYAALGRLAGAPPIIERA